MKNFFKKFIGFSLGPIVGAIISFITVPVTSHLVSADQFGLSNMFTIANSIITLIVLVGIDQAYIREYNETRDKKKLLFNSFLVPFIATICVGVVLILFRTQFAQILFSDQSMIKPIVLLAICTPLFIIEKFMLINLRMEEKAFQYSLWNIVSKALNLILTVIFLMLYKRNFESIIYASIFSQLIVSLILLYVCRKDIGISKTYIDKQQIESILKFGLPLVPATLIGWGLTSMDSIFLRAMTTYTELGYYTVAMKVSNVLALIQSSFTAFWPPMAFKWRAEGQPNKKFELVSDGIAFVMSIILILVLLFKNIIPIIFGSEYENIIYIIPFLLFHPIFYTMSETTTLGIAFSKRTYYNIIVSVVSMLTNFILNWMLIPRYGAIGAAIATGISCLVFFWTRTLISRKLWYKFKLKKFIVITIILLGISLINCIIKNIYMITAINIIGIGLVLCNYRNLIHKMLIYLKNKKIQKENKKI